jgi:hypothetical protein
VLLSKEINVGFLELVLERVIKEQDWPFSGLWLPVSPCDFFHLCSTVVMSFDRSLSAEL